MKRLKLTNTQLLWSLLTVVLCAAFLAPVASDAWMAETVDELAELISEFEELEELDRVPLARATHSSPVVGLYARSNFSRSVFCGYFSGRVEAELLVPRPPPIAAC